MKLCHPFALRIFVATLCLLTFFITPGCTASAKKSRHLSQADKYYKSGDYEKAKIEYLNVLRADPQNVAAIQHLGIMWYEQGAPLRAFPYLLGSRQLAPDDLEVRAKLGLAYLSIAEIAEARKEALAILQKDPHNGQAALLLADTTANNEELGDNEQVLQRLPEQNNGFVLQAKAGLAMRKGDLAAAQEDLARAQSADPNSSFVHLELANLAALRKDPAKVEQELKAAATLSPPRSVARIKYADFKIKVGAIKEAKDLLAETIRLAPDYLPAWQTQAMIASAEKDYDASQASLNHIFSQDANNLEARLLEAENLMAKGESQKAVNALEKLDDVYKNIPLIKLQLARAHIQNNNRNQAIVVLTQAVAIAPTYPDTILLLSELQISSGQAQPAVDALTAFLKKRPDLISGRILLAGAYRTLGRLDDAETTLKNLIKDSPQTSQAYLLLGTVQRQQNKLPEARASFAKAQELRPEDLSALSELVDMDIQQRDYEAAHTKTRAQLQKTAGSAAAQYLEARVYAAQHDQDHAEAALLKTLELDPNFSVAYDLLISSYITTNKLELALGQLNNLLAKDPNNPRVLMMSALIYSKQNAPEKARATYEKLLAANPDAAAALNNLAALYSENVNQLDKAYDLAQKARSLRPDDPAVTDTLAWILYKRGDYQQALRLAQEAAAKLPTQPEVQFHLAMASYMMGQADKARTAFQKAGESKMDFPGKSDIPSRLDSLRLDAAASVRSTTDLEAAVKRDPTDPIAMLRLADAYGKQQAWEKAREAYQKALGINARFLPAIDHLARLYAGPLHDATKAMDYAKSARELAPNEPQTGALLGRATYQSGNFAQAYALLRDAARDLPSDLDVRRDFAMSAYLLGKVEEAREGMQGIVASNASQDTQTKRDAQRFMVLTRPNLTPALLATLESEAQQALQTDPGYVPALMVRAILDSQRGNTKSALDTYTSILQRAPDFTAAQTRLAALYLLEPSTRDKAYELAAKARKNAPNDPEVAELLAASNYYRKEYTYAIQLLQESARQRPLAPGPLYYLGMCYLQTKQFTRSHEALTKALANGLPDPLATDAKKALAGSAP